MGARRRAVHLDVPPQGLPPLVHGRGHGRDGVHGGRVEHERPRVRVPAVPGRDRRGGGRVRGGRDVNGASVLLSARPARVPLLLSFVEARKSAAASALWRVEIVGCINYIYITSFSICKK